MAQGLDDPAATARFDVTPAGFHAQILAAGSTVYIDPASPGSSTHFVFERRAMHLPPFVCAVPAAEADRPTLYVNQSSAPPPTAPPCAPTGWPWPAPASTRTFHGGTKASVLAAMATSMNRVNGIYERELAVRLVLVPNNDTLVFLDADTDPYSNDDGRPCWSENQKHGRRSSSVRQLRYRPRIQHRRRRRCPAAFCVHCRARPGA